MRRTLSSLGGHRYEVCHVGANGMTVDVYSIQGAKVMSLSTDGDTLELDAASLAGGIYVMAVTTDAGTVSRKLAVK